MRTKSQTKNSQGDIREGLNQTAALKLPELRNILHGANPAMIKRN